MGGVGGAEGKAGEAHCKHVFLGCPAPLPMGAWHSFLPWEIYFSHPARGSFRPSAALSGEKGQLGGWAVLFQPQDAGLRSARQAAAWVPSSRSAAEVWPVKEQ